MAQKTLLSVLGIPGRVLSFLAKTEAPTAESVLIGAVAKREMPTASSIETVISGIGGFLLKHDGGYLLKHDGGKIILHDKEAVAKYIGEAGRGENEIPTVGAI